MGGTLRRLRIYYINNKRTSHSLAVIGCLLLLYVIKCLVYPSKPSLGIVRYKHEELETEGMHSDSDIRSILDSLKDTRPSLCTSDKRFHFTNLDQDTVSILTEFNGKQFYDLQLTLTSLVEYTPPDLYKEILVIDDGTTSDVIRKQAERFLKNPKFSKVKLYRSERREGQAVTRQKAALMASGSILVYVSSTSVVNTGWLQPIITHLTNHQQSIIIPHADSLLPGYRFYHTDESLVPVLSWSLYTVYLESSGHTMVDQVSDGSVGVPVMRGDVFAVRGEELKRLGGFDGGFSPTISSIDVEGSAGHHAELSLRGWLCGGGVRLSPCSRVVTHSALRPHHVTEHMNYHRLVELWLGQHRALAYRQGGVVSDLSASELGMIDRRRAELAELTEGGTCRDLNWYFNNVATYMRMPSSDMTQFGKVKVKNNYCLRAAGVRGERGRKQWEVELSLCRQHIYERTMMFELNRSGLIRFISEFVDEDMNCLIVDELGAVRLGECREGEGVWRFEDDRIKYKVGGKGEELCLSHVTKQDSASLEFKHSARVSQCVEASDEDPESIRKQIWEFIHY